MNQLNHLVIFQKTGIRVMAKEKELKIDARDFSVLTLECRFMASMCEKNLSAMILSLFGYQSMTMNGSQLRHKINKLATLPSTDGKIWVVFHMDLLQWNYTFRPGQQLPFVLKLDSLFSVKHFQTCQKIFIESILYSACTFSPPPGIPNEFTCWNNHLGKNQGIFHKK